MDDDNDEDTSLAGVQGDNSSLAGGPISVTTNDNDDNSDAESNNNSIDPNKAENNSSKASIHSTRSHAPVQNMTDKPPQHPLDDCELDNTQLPELETQVPVLRQSERVSVPPSVYIP